MTGLIDDTAEYWKSRGVSVRQWFKDDGGRYGFRMRVTFHPTDDPTDFFVTARSYMQTPLGCMKKLVRRAGDEDGLLLVRAGDDAGEPAFYVFNPATILTHGRDNTADNKRASRGEQWVDFHPHWGVSLQDYVDGDSAPIGPDEPAKPLPSDAEDTVPKSGKTLDDYL